MDNNGSRVCVTGGAGYIGSFLVKKLLEKGHIVHATLRNLNDQSKLSLLRSLPNADTRLVLFKADMYNPSEFEQAIKGCEFVFHVATILQHTEGSQYKNTTEATVDAAKSIAAYCVRSGTVRRLIYTGSVVAASPMKDDGSGFKDFMDETCWTPLHLPFPYCIDSLKAYMDSKTQTEKVILEIGENAKASGLEVVSLACGLVGGDTLLSYTPVTTLAIISQLTDLVYEYNALRYLEELNGKVPLVHIEDVCDAHFFCMDQPSINGRFLCASSYMSTAEIADYCLQHYPDLQVKQRDTDVPKREIRWNSIKLIVEGFKYKYDSKMILEDCIKAWKKRLID